MKPTTPTADRLPPHVPEAEQAAIGCALQEPGLASELKAEWFYDLRYRTAAETLLRMASAAMSIATDTVASELNTQGVADAVQLVQECDAACHSPANWPYWRERLTEALTLRRIVQTAQQACQSAMAADQPTDEILENFEREALAIRDHDGQHTGTCNLRALLLELTGDYEAAVQHGRAMGITTGFYDLDRLLGGLKPQQLAIIAARPSVGKTSLALNIAEHAAVETKLPVAFFSLEMSGKELLHRLACSRARVDGARLNVGAITDAEIQRLTVAHGQIVKAPLHIFDRGGITLAQLTAQCRRSVQQHRTKLLIVDYLGLLRSGEKGRSRYEETTLVSNGLKTLAKELNLPVIALAQLNRDTERDGRPPRLSDLRDSGAIEQDSDIAGLLHRDDDQTGETQAVSLILAKNRSGRTGKVDLIFNRPFTRFESVSRVAP